MLHKLQLYGLVVNCTYTIDAGEEDGQLLGLKAFIVRLVAKRLPNLTIEKTINTKADGGIDKIIKGVKHGGVLSLII